MRGRGWTRRAGAAAIALLALVGLTGCGAAEAPARAPGPLRILLVNDDGWNAPGIVALRDGLRKGGHQVVEVAPVADRSSSGTATTTTGELAVRRPTPDRDVVTVSGTASDAVLVALRGFMTTDPPDLVIAGIASRPALGLDAVRSGTVGAAMVASSLGFPAVAVSTWVEDPARVRPDRFRPAVDFTERLIRTLQEQPASGLVGQRTVLSVNYPLHAAARSVQAAPSSNVPTVNVRYRPGRDRDSYVPTADLAGTAASDGVADDVNAFWRGNVTLTDLTADPDRAAPPSDRTAVRIAPLMKP